MSRKNELETALQSLEREKIRLVEVIEDQTLSPQQIESIYEFAATIGETLDAADQDFHQRRAIVDALDVRVVLTVEDGDKVVYAQCALDNGKLKIDQRKSSGGGNSPDNNIRNMSVENCANYRQKICAERIKRERNLAWGMSTIDDGENPRFTRTADDLLHRENKRSGTGDVAEEDHGVRGVTPRQKDSTKSAEVVSGTEIGWLIYVKPRSFERKRQVRSSAPYS